MAASSPTARRSWVFYAVATVVAVCLLPLALIAIGLFEELVLGTHVSHDICRALGIFDVLEDFVDWMRSQFGG
jgi:hypothetical protein